MPGQHVMVFIDGQRVRDRQRLGGESLWAGTIPGGLFRSSDGGATWQLVKNLWDRPERAEWFGGGYDHPGIHSVCVDPRDHRRVTVAISCGGVWQDPHRVVQCPRRPDVLWAQHHNGIFRSTDAAASWKEVSGNPISSFGFAVAVHPREADTAWFVPAVKDECRVPVDAALCVARTRDGGKSFQALRKGLPQEHAYDLVYRHGLAIDDTGNALALGSTTGGLWVSDDQGDSWRCLSTQLPPIYCVRFA